MRRVLSGVGSECRSLRVSERLAYGGRAARRGVVLAAVLVCLVVLLLVAASLVRTVVLRQQQLRVEQRHVQAIWLAESGVDRAVARSLADADYAGESWEVTLRDAGRDRPAKAEITVEPLEDPPRRRIRVRAFWPADDPVQGVTQQQEIVIRQTVRQAAIRQPATGENR